MSLGGGAAAPLNPNQDVQSDGKIESRAGSSVSFEDLDAADYDPDSGDRKAKKKAEKKEDDKPTSKVKENDSKDAEKAKGPDKKPEKKEKKEESADPSKKVEDADSKGDGEAKPKSKKHRFVHGEESGDLSGDAVFSIPVDGGKEEVPFQELVNTYNGSKLYKKQLDSLNNDKRTFEKDRGELNKTVNDFVERTKKDASAAWDWLAEINGKDPIEFKENMLRAQIKEILPLAKMSEEELDKWISEKKLEWREKRVTNKEKTSQEQAKSQEASGQRKTAQDRFGITDAEYDAFADMARKHPSMQGQEPTAQQVAYLHRWNVAANAIDSAVPHLAKHEKYASIVHDLTETMLQSPKMSQSQLAEHLKETFGGDDKESTRRASKNAKRNASYDEDERGSRTQGPKARKGYESFDDLDD